MVRVGIIGTSKITAQFLQHTKELEDFTQSAIYSRTEERANEFAAEHHIPTTYTELKDLAESDKVDAVYIASPNSFHAEQAIYLMNHGKHILCEKPIASNEKELTEMTEAAKKNNVVLMEAIKGTLLPNFKAIQNNIHKIGKVRRYFASYCQYSSRYDAYKNGTVLNAFNPTFSNGSLMDIGIYCIYPMSILFGEPTQVKANALMLDSGVDGQGSILLGYDDMDGVIMYSKITNSYLPSEIQGENGSMIIDKISEPSKVEIRFRDGTVEDISVPQSNNIMAYEAAEFIRLINEKQLESKLNSHQHSLVTMKVIDEARKQIGLVYPADKNN